MGRKVVADAGTLKEAIGVAWVAELDLAILDLRLGDETTELVAEITRGRGLPFFFLTGHTSDGLPSGFRNAPRLEKPVLCSALPKMTIAARGLERLGCDLHAAALPFAKLARSFQAKAVRNHFNRSAGQVAAIAFCIAAMASA
ncbi:hypothetical protein [Bradyrhizobium sp. USDA 3650]